MNWQQLFMQHILDRGYDYYCDGAVEDLACRDNVITATVCGTEDYEVEITLDDNGEAEMYCPCPYAGQALTVSIWRQFYLRGKAVVKNMRIRARIRRTTKMGEAVETKRQQRKKKARLKRQWIGGRSRRQELSRGHSAEG